MRARAANKTGFADAFGDATSTDDAVRAAIAAGKVLPRCAITSRPRSPTPTKTTTPSACALQRSNATQASAFGARTDLVRLCGSVAAALYLAVPSPTAPPQAGPQAAFRTPHGNALSRRHRVSAPAARAVGDGRRTRVQRHRSNHRRHRLCNAQAGHPAAPPRQMAALMILGLVLPPSSSTTCTQRRVRRDRRRLLRVRRVRATALQACAEGFPHTCRSRDCARNPAACRRQYTFLRILALRESRPFGPTVGYF